MLWYVKDELLRKDAVLQHVHIYTHLALHATINFSIPSHHNWGMKEKRKETKILMSTQFNY